MRVIEGFNISAQSFKARNDWIHLKMPCHSLTCTSTHRTCLVICDVIRSVLAVLVQMSCPVVYSQ